MMAVLCLLGKVLTAKGCGSPGVRPTEQRSDSPGLSGQQPGAAAGEETAAMTVIVKKVTAGSEHKWEGICFVYPAGQVFLDQLQHDCKNHARLGSSYDYRGLLHKQGKDMLCVDKEADLQAVVQACKDRVVRLYIKPKTPGDIKKHLGQTVSAGRSAAASAASGGQAAGQTARGKKYMQRSSRSPLRNLPFLAPSRGSVPDFSYDRDFQMGGKVRRLCVVQQRMHALCQAQPS